MQTDLKEHIVSPSVLSHKETGRLAVQDPSLRPVGWVDGGRREGAIESSGELEMDQLIVNLSHIGKMIDTTPPKTMMGQRREYFRESEIHDAVRAAMIVKTLIWAWER